MTRPTRAETSLRQSGNKAEPTDKWLTFAYSARGEAFTEDGGSAAINSEAARAALERYKTILSDRPIALVDVEEDQQGIVPGAWPCSLEKRT